MSVRATGKISVFERDGQYQLYVEDMQPDGVGALAAAFEQLKAKLEGEGLFARERKRPLPDFPQRIGVITSPSGAAVRDIFKILSRRYPTAEIVFCPAVVQGAAASASLIRALDIVEAQSSVDVIIIGRGGGSIEDLWCFNDERLVRRIAACCVPIISAVGHETDFTLSDFAADVRAATPSAAAELAVPDSQALLEELGEWQLRLMRAVRQFIQREKSELERCNLTLGDKGRAAYLSSKRNEADMLSLRLEACYKTLLSARRADFSRLATQLDALSPLKVMGRGYCLASTEGKIIQSASDIRPMQKIDLRFVDIEAKCTVDEIKRIDA